MTVLWHPALILLAGAMLIGITRGKVRAAVVLGAPLLALAAAWLVPDGVTGTAKFLKYQLELVEGSSLRRLFGAVFAVTALACGLYGLRQAKWYELAAGYGLAAGAMGIAFAGDVVSLFVLWQVMVIFSTVLVFCGGTPTARAAGIRYAIMHLMGGLIFKVGIEGVIHGTGGIDIQPFAATDFYGWSLLIGVSITAAAAPVSVWLTDAYPRSSPIGSVFLPGFTTTSAVLALSLLFPGERVLIGLGLAMIFYGVIYGIFESDLRRLLSYALIHQLGFTLCLIGVGTNQALGAAAAVVIAQSIAFTLLFMTAGAVIRQTGRERLDAIGGLGRAMPFTAICAAVGALAVAALPLAAGFAALRVLEGAVSQTMYWLLAAGSAGVLLHAGLKYPWLVFVEAPPEPKPDSHANVTEAAGAELESAVAAEKPDSVERSGERTITDPPWHMASAMGLLAALTLALGILPQALYGLLKEDWIHTPYALGTVGLYLAMLLASGAAFFLLRPVMRRARGIPFDVDWVWRVLLVRLGGLFIDAVRAAAGIVRDLYDRGLRPVLREWVNRRIGPEGTLSRAWSIGTTALWVALLLSGYVLVHYFAL